MNKRGISPLIATVLIIGFTVALAAIIITWGTRFVTTTQESVGKQADVSVACSGIDFDITECKNTDGGQIGSYDFSLTSNTNQKITDLILRVYDGTTTYVDQSTMTGDLEGFGVATVTFFDARVTTKVAKVQALAKIQLEGQGETPCAAPIVEYVPRIGECGNL